MASRSTAMLCTSNGVGLGHLSRVMAVGRHLREDFDVVLFTLSAAVSIPVAEGFRTEYLRSHEYSALDSRDWNSLLEQRLEHLQDMHEPTLILFDGTHPYAGLCRYLDRHPELMRVWERRGMWRAGRGSDGILKARHFDFVVEPGDYAQENDVGVTSRIDEGVVRFPPIRYGSSPLDRGAARDALGIGEDETAALVQLGAGQINDVSSLIHRAVSGLRDRGVSVVVAASVLAERPDVDLDGVTVVQRYPISDYFDAFDLGFFAGGYNSFHEAMSLGLPSVFVPNVNTKLDDQAARTRFAHDRGLGLDWSDGESATLDVLLDRILDPGERDRFRSSMRDLPAATGGRDIADWLRRNHIESSVP